MRVFGKVLLTLLCVGSIVTASVLGFKYSKVTKEKQMLVEETAQLQGELDAIGPYTTGWTVAANVNSGDIITPESLTEQTILVSTITEQTILDASSVEGLLYKVNISPGTTLTSDMVMSNEFVDTAYQEDLVFDHLPLGIRVGDYIDIKMTLPYGETLTVITHKRVENIVQDAKVLQVYLTPAQQLLWRSALKDKALYGQKGLSVYATKYVEPGIQADTAACYPIRQEMEAVAVMDINIKDKKECVNHNLRVGIDTLMEAVTDKDSGSLNSGNSAESSAINNAVSTYVDEKANSSDVLKSDEELYDEEYDEYIIDLNEEVDMVEDSLEEF